MEPTIYTPLKVNNEIELCKVFNMEAKQQLESFMLKHGISYCLRWEKPKLFSKKNEGCIFCINATFKDAASQGILEMPENIRNEIEMLLVPSHNEFL